MNAQTHDGADQVLALQRRWLEVELRGDVAALEPMLHEDFLAVGPLGFMLTKQQWFDRHRPGELEYQELTGEDATIRQFGDASIVVFAQTQRATYQGREVQAPGNRFRVTLIVVREGGRLAIAGVHLSPIAQPPGR